MQTVETRTADAFDAGGDSAKEAVGEALKRMGGRLGLYLRLIDLFGVVLAEKLEQLPLCCGGADRGKLRFTAHALAGAALTVGAEGLSRMACAIEEKSDSIDAQELDEAVCAMWRRGGEFLRQFDDRQWLEDMAAEIRAGQASACGGSDK